MNEEEKTVEGREQGQEDGDVNPIETTDDTQPSEKTLTQSQVNEIVGRIRQETREKLTKELTESLRSGMLEKYGVENDEELDTLFGRGQIYENLNSDYENKSRELREALSENALLKSRTDPERWEDIKLILGGKGLEVNVMNIEAEAERHPEWFKNETVSRELGEEQLKKFSESVEKADFSQPRKAVIRKLGNDPQNNDVSKDLDEEALVNKYFFHK